jgi:hypothetical protein
LYDRRGREVILFRLGRDHEKDALMKCVMFLCDADVRRGREDIAIEKESGSGSELYAGELSAHHERQSSCFLGSWPPNSRWSFAAVCSSLRLAGLVLGGPENSERVRRAPLSGMCFGSRSRRFSSPPQEPGSGVNESDVMKILREATIVPTDSVE